MAVINENVKCFFILIVVLSTIACVFLIKPDTDFGRTPDAPDKFISIGRNDLVRGNDNREKLTRVVNAVAALGHSENQALISNKLPQTAKSITSLAQDVMSSNCYDLFKSTGKNVTQAYPPKFIEARLNHEAFVTRNSMNVEGNSAKYIEQVAMYLKIIEFPFIKTICETGFNAGHDTLVWLSTRNDTMVYSFDLGEHDYAMKMADYLQRLYPNRLSVYWGDSTKTVKTFQDRNPEVKCDLLVIDGGHTYEVAKADFENLRRMANVHNLVIFDDYPSSAGYFIKHLGPVWDGEKRRGTVEEYFSCKYKLRAPLFHGFSIGSFII